MADAPWRCSQCGTVNEPVANSCRTCGRWPSLFDLEESLVETSPRVTYDDADEYAAQTVDVEVAEPDVYEPASPSDVPPENERVPHEANENEAAEPKPLWQRLASLVVPIGIVLYILVSTLVNRDAG